MYNNHAHYTNGANVSQHVKSKSTTVTERFDTDGKLVERTTDEFVEYVEPQQVRLAQGQHQWWYPTITNGINTIPVDTQGGYEK